MALLEANGISKRFRGMAAPAVDEASITVDKGEFVGLVGGSGSGKSTLACIIMNLMRASGGTVIFGSERIDGLEGKRRRAIYSHMQMVFQDQDDAFNPRYRLRTSLVEFGKIAGLDRRQAIAKATDLFEKMGLDADHLDRFPFELSGGQKQRAALARALMVDPDLLVCDEITSALDVSVQANIVSLVKQLRGTVGMLFISHDLALVDHLCDRAYVMQRGRIVESGTSREITQTPLHPYTQLLASSVFPVARDDSWRVPSIKTSSEGPSHVEGCLFYDHCGRKQGECLAGKPLLREVTAGHFCACPHASLPER